MICRQCYLDYSTRETALISKLAARDKTDIPLRAKSVCLAERPKSQYGRNIRSADAIRSRFSDKHYVHRQPSASGSTKRNSKPTVIVKEIKRKPIEKVPCAVSVQTLSIPMTYADNYKHPTSKRVNVSNLKRIDNRAKCNFKQAVERKLCHAACGRETENKLLLQICEAEQVSDFERILNSNAILRERARRHVWRGAVAPNTPSASLLPRPRSTYSLRAVSQAYHTLFRQHEESIQQLVDRYRQEAADQIKKSPSLLESNWFEDLQGLTEFYEDDPTLQKEIETITDRIIAEAAQTEGGAATTRSNFSVNLAGLISLHVNGEGVSPTFRDDLGPSPEVEKVDHDDKEWLSPIMSANSDDRRIQDSPSIDRLSQDLSTVQIECDGKVPTITFSNCCEGRNQSDKSDNNDVVIHLAVPSIESPGEARPPMM